MMSDMRKLLEAMDSMTRAEKKPTGPKFPGYWKGTDPASKARSKMVGSAEESVIKDLHNTAKKKAAEWDLGEAFKNFKEQDTDTATTTVDTSVKAPVAQPSLSQQVKDVAAASGIKDPNLIYPGDKIKLPAGGEYTVVPGDTLSGILTGKAKGPTDSRPTTTAAVKTVTPAPAPTVAAPTTNNPWAGKDTSKADAWSRLNAEQQKWLGGADPTNTAILNRMPKASVPTLSNDLDKVNKMIAGAESQNNHNITFGDRVGKDGKITNAGGLITPEEFAGKSLSDMTMAEVAAFQAARNKQSPGSGAVGKYQFMPSTLSSYAAKIGLKPTDKFDADTQQKLQDALLADNKANLEKSGIQATPANMYMAHYVGPGGATAVHAAAAQDPDTSVADALVKQKLSKNPKLDYDTEYAKLTKHNSELGRIKAKDFEGVLANRLEKKYAQSTKPSVAETTDRFVEDFKTFLEGKEADYGDEFQSMVKRLGQKAKQGPMKTIWDPVKRVYKTVPVKAKEKEVKEYENEQSPNVQTTSPPDPDASASSQFTARGNEIRNQTLEQALPNAQNPDTQTTSKGNEGGATPDQQTTSSAVQKDPEAKDELQDRSVAHSAMNSLKGVLGPKVNTNDAAMAATKISSGQQPTGKESAAFQSLMPLVAKAAEDPSASASLRNALHQAGINLKLGKK